MNIIDDNNSNLQTYKKWKQSHRPIDEETKLVKRKFALMEAMQLVAVFTGIVVS